jgi:hypothetical protein
MGNFLTTTNSSGNYSFTNVPWGWSGTARPYKAGYSFDPIKRDYIDLSSNKINQDYAATYVACTGATGYVKNGSFEIPINDTITEYEHYSPFFLGQVCHWYAGWGSPQINPYAISGPNHYARMWSKAWMGEGIYAYVSLEAGKQYTLEYDYKVSENPANRISARLLPTGVVLPGGTTGDGQLIPDELDQAFVIDSMINVPISADWIHRSVSFTVPAGATFNRIVFSPGEKVQNQMAPQAWLWLDNIKITAVGGINTGKEDPTVCKTGECAPAMQEQGDVPGTIEKDLGM